MISENVESFATEGEKQFYRFLESVAKPDSQYIAWYTPDLKGRDPTLYYSTTRSDSSFLRLKIGL